MSVTAEGVMNQLVASGLQGAISAGTVFLGGKLMPSVVSSDGAMRAGVGAAVGTFGAAVFAVGVANKFIPPVLANPVVTVIGNETFGVPVQSGLGNVALNYAGPYSSQSQTGAGKAFIEGAASTFVGNAIVGLATSAMNTTEGGPKTAGYNGQYGGYD